MFKLMLNKELYNIDTVNNAVIAFNNIAKINIRDEENYIFCLFESAKYGEVITMKEFENYIIDLMNQRNKI